MRPLAVLAAAALASLAVRTVGAQGLIVPRPCPVPLDDRRLDDRPGIRPPVPCRPIGQAIVRTRSDVRAELVDRVLRWEVEERFVNRGGAVGEADYVFPLPKGGAFRDLKLSINGELVAGETMGAGEARRIYEEIVRRQRDPALVEWMGSGLLRARIFPIAPGEEKRVVVRFESVVEREGDAWRVDYARGASVGREPGADGRAPRAERREPTFVLTYPVSAQLGRPYSPTHELDDVVRDGRHRVEARGGARDVTVLLPLRRSDAPSITTLAHAPGRESGFALITVAPPARRAAAATPRDVAFVLDASGSMSGDKMEQAKAAGRQLLATLRPSDRFRIIDFSTDVRTFRDGPVFATPANVRAAQRYLESLEASGSTNIAGALAEALRGGWGGDEAVDAWPARERDDSLDEGDDDGLLARRRVRGERLRLVLFLTDGEPTVGERSPEALARQAARDRRGARLFTFGLGADVNAALLERVALEGGGTAQFVRPDESVERMVGIVASRLVDPVLTDVRVRLEGGDVRLEKMHPSQPLDLFAGQDLLLLARYRGHGRARVVVEGRRRDERVRWTSDVDFPERERDNPFVARLWAVQRIGYLSAERRRNGPTPELDDEIRTLGERFGIPTELTAYLVLEPGMVAGRRRDVPADANMRGQGGSVSSAPAPAPMAARERSFESAKAASQQRAARSLADVDSVSAVSGGAPQRVVGDRTFVLRGGRWTDSRFRDGVRTVKIKAFSPAYFALLDRLPELAQPLALGDRVLVAGARVAVDVGDEGTSELDDGALRQLVNDWR